MAHNPRALVALLCLGTAGIGAPTAFAASAADTAALNDFIVQVQPGENLDEHLENLFDDIDIPDGERDDRVAIKWECAINGAWLRLTDAEMAEARKQEGQPGVVNARPAQLVEVDPDFNPHGMGGVADVVDSQTVPTSNQRIGWTEGSGEGVNVAVLDTGIDSSRDDLNVVGGYNATLDGRGPQGWGIDDFGHSTWVASQIGAINNDRGTVGIAAGANLYSVPVLSQGYGSYASILNGVDWVCQQNVDLDASNDISVVNLSLGGQNLPSICNPETMPLECDSWDALHNAFYTLELQGVVTVVSAGNSGMDAVGFSPANYSESVITVSAVTDYDGLPGGLAVPPDGYDVAPDDQLAPFSNFGSMVDFAAPGVYGYGELPLNMVGRASGTSMAAPVVAGVFAEYKNRCGVGGDAAVSAVFAWSTQPGWVKIDGLWTGDHGPDKEPMVRAGAPCVEVAS